MVIFLKLEYARIPIVSNNERFKIRIYSSDQRHIYHVTARYGYSEHKIHLSEILQLLAADHQIAVPDNSKISFYIPAISVRVVRKGWRALPSKCILLIYSVLKNVFPFGQKNLRYPPDNTVSVGMMVPL